MPIPDKTLAEMSGYLNWYKKLEAGAEAGFNLMSSTVNCGPRDWTVPIEELRIPHGDILREKIRNFYQTGDREILLTYGGSTSMSLICMSLLSPSDHVLIENPTYQSLRSSIQYALGGDPKNIHDFPRKWKENYELDLGAVATLLTQWKPRMIVLSDLQNPTGVTISEEKLRQLARLIQSHNARQKKNGKKTFVVIDETFLDLNPDRRPIGAAIHEDFISISTLSKVYGLSPIRCGWAVIPPGLRERIWNTYVVIENIGSRVTENFSIMAFENLEAVRQQSIEYCARNRQIVAEGTLRLRNDGLIEGEIPPTGCIYFPRVRGLRNTNALCDYLRERKQVHLVPGSFFGDSRHVRIGFADRAEKLTTSLREFSKGLRAYQRSNKK